MESYDKAGVYIVLGLAIIGSILIATIVVLNHLETTCAIKAGLVQELRSEGGVTKVIWVKDKQND